MVARVKKHVGLSTVLLAGLLACKDEEDAFLPPNQLCPRLAEDICGARALCGCEQTREECEENERKQCEPLRHAFEEEDALHYHTVLAEKTRSAQASALVDACSPPLPLGHFYQGTLDDGADCERDTQCTSAYCDPATQLCASPEPVELCPAP
jgi:hypothetical protein